MKNEDFFGNFEKQYRQKLDNTLPAIIRLDGKSFSSLSRIYFPTTKTEPFSPVFKDTMVAVAKGLFSYIKGFVWDCFVVSDEISFYMEVPESVQDGEYIYGGVTNKINSILASYASLLMDRYITQRLEAPMIPMLFDCRCFNLDSKATVDAYFKYRKSNGVTNSVNTIARSYYTQKQLNGLSILQIEDKLKNEQNIDLSVTIDQFGKGVMIHSDTITGKGK